MKTKRPWWQWALFAIVALVILGALLGEDDSEQTATETKTVTVTQPPPTTATTPSEPGETLANAREAVDDDDYTKALAIAAALGAAEEDAIRRRIANRIGRRALAAVRAGDRNSASSLLRRAGGYPRTQQLTQARASYRAAKARAAERARARRLAAEQEREAEEQRERAPEEADQAEAQPETGSGCDPNYSGCVPAYPPDVNCPEVEGPVQVTGSDPHGLDRDGDGIACE